MKQTIQLQIGGSRYEVAVDTQDSGYVVRVDGRSYRVDLAQGPGGRMDLALRDAGSGQKRARVHLVREGRRQYAATGGATWIIETPAPGRARARDRADGTGSLVATMPGLVLDVLVEPGTSVEAGATLVLLEAMKMELRITAPTAGRVSAVHCAAGEVVERGRELVVLEP